MNWQPISELPTNPPHCWVLLAIPTGRLYHFVYRVDYSRYIRPFGTAATHFAIIEEPADGTPAQN